jgi:hypothetical protein
MKSPAQLLTVREWLLMALPTLILIGAPALGGILDKCFPHQPKANEDAFHLGWAGGFGFVGLVIAAVVSLTLGQWISWRFCEPGQTAFKLLGGVALGFCIYALSLAVAFPACAFML